LVVAGESVEKIHEYASRTRLTAKAIESAALSLESVDNIQGGDGLSLSVLGVRDSITDDSLKEGLEHTTGFFVDHCAKRQREGIGHGIQETYWQRYA
jgi:hypothetical protein